MVEDIFFKFLASQKKNNRSTLSDSIKSFQTQMEVSGDYSDIPLNFFGIVYAK